MSGLPAFASIDDLVNRIDGGVSDRVRPRAQAALDDASALIRTVVSNNYVDDANALLTTVPAIFLSVTCASARRAIDNPDGLTAETLGGYTAQYANASGDVYLTKAETAMVRKAAGVDALWTQSTTRDPDARGLDTPPVLIGGPGPSEYLETDGDGGGEPILWGGPDAL